MPSIAALFQPNTLDSTAGFLLVLLGAVVIELIWGEPPARLHPVVWMGNGIELLMRRTPSREGKLQLAHGLGVTAVMLVVFTTACHALLDVLREYPAFQLGVAAIVLSTTFSLRALGKAALDMASTLGEGAPLAAARPLLRSLCSRDPSTLDEERLAAATIESVAENASDSFVAPLLFFACFGVEGAVAYRVVNTLDAMIGYHGKYEYLGKCAARLDDLANWIPARVSALLLLVAAWLLIGGARDISSARGWLVGRRDHHLTESPNAGWPMATMAGLLNVQLVKDGHYALGDPGVRVGPAQIRSSWSIVRASFFLAVAVSLSLRFTLQKAWGS